MRGHLDVNFKITLCFAEKQSETHWQACAEGLRAMCWKWYCSRFSQKSRWFEDTWFSRLHTAVRSQALCSVPEPCAFNFIYLNKCWEVFPQQPKCSSSGLISTSVCPLNPGWNLRGQCPVAEPSLWNVPPPSKARHSRSVPSEALLRFASFQSHREKLIS